MKYAGIVWVWMCSVAVWAYDPMQREEPAGISLLGFRAPDGEVYGGGVESGVWIIGTPIFGEVFGHWLSNDLQGANYYGIGTTVRLMLRSRFAPFIGVGGSYNGLYSEHAITDQTLFRPADRDYWKGHAEAGLRLWMGGRHEWFLEGSYRYHWTTTGGDFNYGWIGLELGQLF